jgi:hypothetical protein
LPAQGDQQLTPVQSVFSMRSKLDTELLISMRLCMAAMADANLWSVRGWRRRGED